MMIEAIIRVKKERVERKIMASATGVETRKIETRESRMTRPAEVMPMAYRTKVTFKPADRVLRPSWRSSATPSFETSRSAEARGPVERAAFMGAMMLKWSMTQLLVIVMMIMIS